MLGLPNGYITALCDERCDYDFMIRLGQVMKATVTRAIALETKIDLRPGHATERQDCKHVSVFSRETGKDAGADG